MAELKIVGGVVTAVAHQGQIRFELEDGSTAMVECEIEPSPEAPVGGGTGEDDSPPAEVEGPTTLPSGDEGEASFDQTDSSGDVPVPEA